MANPELDNYVTAKPIPTLEHEAHGIGWAVKQMWDKKRVRRAGWNGKGMHIYIVPGSNFQVNREPLLSLMGAGTWVSYQPHVDMFTANGTVVPWLCSQSDLLAVDWELA